MKREAKAVIIGGGIVGCSVLYHLAKAGMKDAVLLEKSELTAGSTWHAAGLTTWFNNNPNLRRIHWYSINFYKQLEQETGQAVGLHTPGSIRLATTRTRVDEARMQMSRAGWNKAPQYWVSPKDIRLLHPLLDTDDVIGGIYTPGDGHIDPYLVTQAIAAGARRLGGEIYLPAKVEAITFRADGRWDVATQHGTITTEHVVNTSGFWAQEVGRLAGIELPVISVEHQYVISGPIPEVQARDVELPVIRDLEGSYYLRQERNGLLAGPYEKPEKMKLCVDWHKKGVPPGFGKELFPADVDRISENLATAMQRVPVFEKAGIKNVICGPISYAPDAVPIVGQIPGARNQWAAVGMSYGIAHAGGMGKYLADWIVTGEPPQEMAETDPARFGKWATAAYVRDKARESYGYNNIPYFGPQEERPAARPVRVNPIYYELKKRGAEFGFHNGWEQPNWFALPGDNAGYFPSFRRTNWFEPVGREVKGVKQSVGVIDLTPFSKYEVSGAGAEAFMEKMCANRMPKLGRCGLAHMITPRGMVYAELTVTRVAPDTFYVITGSGVELHDLRWLQNHLPPSGVRIANVTEQYAVLSVAGPRSRDVLQKLTDADMSDAAFKFLTCQHITLGPAPVRAIRVSYTGELGWELHVPMVYTAGLYQALLQAGLEFGICDFGTYAMNSLRLEKGFRVWGSEMNKDTSPLEAGLDRFIRFDKGDFIGRDALLKQKEAGLKRKLVFLTVNTEDADPIGNESVWYDGKVAGMTTSGSFCYSVNKGIAYAYVPLQLAQPGTQLHVELLGRMCAAVVVPEPLIPADNVKPKKE